MPGSVNVGGSWKTVNAASVNVNGTWKSVASGFVNVAGAWKQWYSSAPPPAYELIATVVGTGSSVGFTSIPQDYKHLQIRFTARSNANFSTARPVYITYSGSASGYAGRVLYSDGSSVATAYVGGNPNVAYVPCLTGATGSFGAGIIDILDYTAGNKLRSSRSFYGHQFGSNSGSGQQSRDHVSINGGSQIPTTTVTSLSLIEATGGFIAGSRFSLYGIKG
jgi:hypothetical protein